MILCHFGDLKMDDFEQTSFKVEDSIFENQNFKVLFARLSKI